VPRDRVFIDGRVDIYNRIRDSGIVENLTNQTTIRALTKLEFAYGLATRLAAAINDQSRPRRRCSASCSPTSR
jgi:4-hydroxyphenylacetate 3-monooxygenase/anthranilate 3-monooxygenase (FAD)/4-hydroxyphenylacetate 3-monooxygenase